MWSLGRAAAVQRQFRPGIAGVRPGKGRGVIWGLLGFGSWLDWGRGAAGEPARRSCGLPAAAARCSRRREHGLDLLATREVPVSIRDGLRVVGCGGEAGGGGARVGRDGEHGASAGEGNRALYSRPMRRLTSSGPKEAPREHARQATADGPQGNTRDRTAARRSRRPRHARGVGKG
jgi:hypothetical protein